jgi:chromosomal replication initiator protein
VRELEGNLVKLGAYSDLMNVDIDLEIAKQQLNLSQSREEKALDINAIGNAVANHFSIPLGDIRGKTRKKDVVLGRHIAMYMSHKILKVTLEEIGDYFEKRDHSTVIHGVKKIEDLSKKDSKVSQHIYEIESSL